MCPCLRTAASWVLLMQAALCMHLPAAQAAPVSAASSITVGMAGPGATGPFDTTPVATARPSDADAQGEFHATAAFGSGGAGAGSSTLSGSTYWASVYAPNNYRQPVTSHGGTVKIDLMKSFQKTESDATLSSIFTGFTARVGYDPEFGPRCPPGDEGCLQAGWTWTAKVYDSDMNLTFQAVRFASVSSDPTKSSGFIFTELTQFLALDLEIGPYGVDLSTPPSQNVAVPNIMAVSLALNEIEVGEVFNVSFTLEAWAFDSGSDIGPGRFAHVFVKDPLDADRGIGFQSMGLLEIGTVGGSVPAPASAWLALAGGLALLAQRRRRGPGQSRA